MIRGLRFWESVSREVDTHAEKYRWRNSKGVAAEAYGIEVDLPDPLRAFAAAASQSTRRDLERNGGERADNEIRTPPQSSHCQFSPALGRHSVSRCVAICRPLSMPPGTAPKRRILLFKCGASACMTKNCEPAEFGFAASRCGQIPRVACDVTSAFTLSPGPPVPVQVGSALNHEHGITRWKSHRYNSFGAPGRQAVHMSAALLVYKVRRRSFLRCFSMVSGIFFRRAQWSSVGGE